MKRGFVLLALVAGCVDESGALVDVTQSEQIADKVDVLHMYVGISDGAAGFWGRVHDGDEVFLDTPLEERPYTIRLAPSAEMAADTPVRLVVIGQHGDVPNGFGVLDLPGLPSDLTLRYELVLEPIGQVGTTETGCVGDVNGVLIVGKDDRDCDGFKSEDGGDCDDENWNVHPGAYDACEGESLGVDDDCNDTADDGDGDGDGATCLRDCDDANAERSPDAREDCDGGVDNDCDDAVDEGEPEVCMNGINDDCDALTPDTGLLDEVCADGADNDCDLEVDEGRTGDGGVLDDDVDGDEATCATDCDDDNPLVFPGGEEICDQTDNNCDGAQDEGVNEDGDPALCINDCNDRNEDVYPGAHEICDTFDNDCVPGTHASPTPCFDYGTDPCKYGFLSCNEKTGVYSDVCEPMLTNPVVADPVCPQFMSCSASTADDRLAACGQPTYDCTQMVLGTGPTVCGESFHHLVAPNDPTACQWAIIGGRTQQGWTVGLVSESNPAASAVQSSCAVDFSVQAVPAGLQPATFAVALSADNVYSHTEVFTIWPERNAVCAIPSLVCSP